MKKRISKILCSIILIMMLVIQIMPISVFAVTNEELDEDIAADLEAARWVMEDNYDVIDAAFNYNDKKFDEWSDAMIRTLLIGVGDSDYDGDLKGDLNQTQISNRDNGTLAVRLSNLPYSDEENKKTDIKHASEAMHKLLGDIGKIAEMNNYVLDGDIYVGKVDITTADLGIFNEVVDKIWDRDVDLHDKEKERILKFRTKLLNSLGSNLGPYQTKSEIARKNFNAASIILSGTDNGPGFMKSVEEKRKFDADTIRRYYLAYGYNYVGSTQDKNDIERAWLKTLQATDEYKNITTTKKLREWADSIAQNTAAQRQGKTEDEINAMDAQTQEENLPKEDKDKDTVFQQPKNKTAVDPNASQDLVQDAEEWLQSIDDSGVDYVSTENLQVFSQSLYSILFGIGIIVAVLVGSIIGIKLMISPVEQRAEAKKLLIPYVAGCVIVFGAFGIWQLVVTIMQGV